MIIAVFILVILIVGGRLVAVRKRPAQSAVIFTIAVTLSGIGFGCQVFPSFMDRGIGIVNFSDILHHSLSVVIMALSLLFVKTLTFPHRLERRAVQRATVVTTGLMVLLWAQWLTLPGRSVESPNDAGGWQNLIGPYAFVTILYNVYIVGGFAILVWQSVFGSKDWFADLPMLRRASVIMGVGLSLMGLSQAILFVRVVAVPSYFTLTSLYWAVVCLQSVVFSIGLFLPIPGRMLAQIREQREQLARLDPLWRHVTNWFPDTELRTGRTWTPRRLAVTTTRRFVEIKDSLNRLMLPLDAVDLITDDPDPVRRLGQYLSTFQPSGAHCDDGEPASAVLPVVVTPEADRAQVLLVADAFRFASSTATAREDQFKGPILSAAVKERD